MQKDKRAKTVKQLIEHNEIKHLTQIFDVIPVTVVALVLSSNNVQFGKKIANPGTIRMNDIIAMASYFEVDERVMIDIVHGQIVVNRGKKKGRK